MKQSTTNASFATATAAATITPPPVTAASAQPAPVPTIALRKSCNPDGIGLSHYVLMDRKVAK